MQHRAHRALVADPPLDPFRHQLEAVLHLGLEVAVGRAARHGAQGPHAAIGLEGTPAVEEHLARRLVGAGEQRLPIITQSAPAAMALAMSPEERTPPSAMAGTPWARAAAAHSITAVSCGTPTPATTRVVQMEPGPMPIFTASAPASISASTASGVATLPATTCTLLDKRLMRSTVPMHARRMPVGGVHHHHVHVGLDQRLGALVAVLAHADGGGDAQPAERVLHGGRIGLRLVHVLHGDEADAAVLLVHHQKLLDAVLRAAGRGPARASRPLPP